MLNKVMLQKSHCVADEMTKWSVAMAAQLSKHSGMDSPDRCKLMEAKVVGGAGCTPHWQQSEAHLPLNSQSTAPHEERGFPQARGDSDNALRSE